MNLKKTPYCWICNELLKNHKRCPHCKILIHENVEDYIFDYKCSCEEIKRTTPDFEQVSARSTSVMAD